MKSLAYRLMVFLLTLSAPSVVHAGLLDRVVRAAGAVTAKKAAGEALEQGSKSLARRMAQETAEASAKKVATRTMLGFTDDAIRLAGSKAGAMALADDVATATSKLSAKNVRRLSMLSNDIERSGQASLLMQHLAKDAAADQCVDFLWRNKGAIASGAIITTLVLNPDIIKESTGRIGETVVETTGREILAPMIGGSIIRAWLFVAAGVFVIAATIGIWFRSAKLRRSFAWAAILSQRR
jgi:hypothetical protein